MSGQKKELILRAEAKKKQMEADLAKLKADTQGFANDEEKKLEKKIIEMSNILKEASENLTESLAKKINNWLR